MWYTPVVVFRISTNCRFAVSGPKFVPVMIVLPPAVAIDVADVIVGLAYLK